MPQLGANQTSTTTIELPSTKDVADPTQRAQVTLKTKLYPADLEGVDAIEGKINQGAHILSRLITDWNFTVAGTEEKAAITVENIKQLEIVDFKRLSEEVVKITEGVAQGVDLGLKEISSPTL